MSRPLAPAVRDQRDGSLFLGLVCVVAFLAVCTGVLIGTSALIVWLAHTTVAHAVPFAFAGLVLLGVAGFLVAEALDRVRAARRRRRVLASVRDLRLDDRDAAVLTR